MCKKYICKFEVGFHYIIYIYIWDAGTRDCELKSKQCNASSRRPGPSCPFAVQMGEDELNACFLTKIFFL